MQYAIDAAPAGQGIDLVPADPLVAAQMRVKMIQYDKLFSQYFGPVGMSRF